MIVRAPPLEMSQELWGLLSCSPGATCQSCHPMSNGQIHPLNKSSVQPSREAQFLQSDLESSLCSKAHHVRDLYQLTPLVTFLDLAVDQTCRYLPSAGFSPLTPHFLPLSKMSGQSIEIQIEAITGEERQAARSQELSEGVDEQMSYLLRTGTEMKHRNDRA